MDKIYGGERRALAKWRHLELDVTDGINNYKYGIAERIFATLASAVAGVGGLREIFFSTKFTKNAF